jgi:WD40 repeat protein
MEGRTIDFSKGNRLFLLTDSSGEPSGKWKGLILRSWDFKKDEPQIIGHISTETIQIPFGASTFSWNHIDIDVTARWMAYSSQKSIYIRSLEDISAPPRLIGEHAADAAVVTFHPDGQEIVSSDVNGEIRLWSVDSSRKTPLRIIPGNTPIFNLQFNHSGSVLVVSHRNDSVQLMDLRAPLENETVILRRNVAPFFPSIAVSPDDQWGAVPYSDSVAVWPLNLGLSRVLHGNGDEGIQFALDFIPDGKFLAAGFMHGSLYLWPFPSGVSRILWKPNEGELGNLRADPTGRFIGVGTSHQGAVLVSIADGKGTPLPGTLFGRAFEWFTFTPDGKVAAVANAFKRDDSGIRIWDLQSNEVRILDESKGMAFSSLEFVTDGRLFSADDQGYLREWDLKTGKSRVELKIPGKGIVTGSIAFAKNNSDLMACVVGDMVQDWQEYKSELKLFHLKDKTFRTVSSHGNSVMAVRIDPSGKILVTGDVNGVVRVGPISGEEPHLLFGHGSPVRSLAIHPNDQWIASSEVSHPIVRVWPMPKGEPIQALPYQQLLSRLRALTNIRIVADPSSTSGYRTKFEPFQGWKKVPEW